ncbi:Calcium-binding protein CP1 [Linum grandiflorum]
MCPSGRSLPAETGYATPELKSAFDVIDADQDGKISRDDLCSFYAGIRTASTSDIVSDDDEMIGTMMSLADSDKDGFVQYEEFERVLGGGRKGKSAASPSSDVEGIMADVFKAMDTDGDGKLSHGDLKSYLQLAGFDASDDEIRAMIKLGAAAGGDENDGVSYEGLLRILAVE